MPEVDTGPELKDDDKVRFLESHRPALDDGVYTVTVTHHLEVNGQTELDAKRSTSFVVAGPRFVLAPGEIVSCFPPRGARGDFDAVLPHVVLRRVSLPWERSTIDGMGRDGPPWLALLVLEEGEIWKSETVPASQLMAAKPKPPAAPFAELPQGPGDDPKQQVLVIEISADTAQKILPAADELPLLTGVRHVNGTDCALVVANRLPASDAKRKHVHLVSLEGQYRPAAKTPPTHEHWASGLTTGNIRLVSLAQWDFFCDAPEGHLAAILNKISVRRPKLDATGLGASFGPVQAGAVPVEYRLATGERTAAWYHGPLAVRDHGAALELPVRRADELLLVERATGMPDISYAAAWELGRLLALRDPAVGIRLNQWKRQVAHAGHAGRWMDVAPETVEMAPACPMFPLRDWFENALARLVAVPFNYLVPDPGLLPPETICLFNLDEQWIAALFDGAFSIGRNSERQRTADRDLRQALPKIRPCSGILLRSAAVAGWPDLVVDGFGVGKKLTALRFERLAKDTLLVLFEGAIGSAQVHPHPQALHFGFDGDETVGFSKGGKPVPFRAGDAGVVNISALKTTLGATGSHDFAPLMIEGAPKVSYFIQTVEVTHV